MFNTILNTDRTSELGVGGAARALGVAEATIRRWDATGKLPSRRTSAGWRIFRLRDIERLVAERAKK